MANPEEGSLSRRLQPEKIKKNRSTENRNIKGIPTMTYYCNSKKKVSNRILKKKKEVFVLVVSLRKKKDILTYSTVTVSIICSCTYNNYSIPLARGCVVHGVAQFLLRTEFSTCALSPLQKAESNLNGGGGAVGGAVVAVTVNLSLIPN